VIRFIAEGRETLHDQLLPEFSAVQRANSDLSTVLTWLFLKNLSNLAIWQERRVARARIIASRYRLHDACPCRRLALASPDSI
jgi:hypothetical protein